MKETFQNLITFLKNPVLEKDTNTSLSYRFNIFSQILIISILTTIIISPIFALFEALKWIHMENHKVKALFDNMEFLQFFLLGAMLMPLLEETIFRGPITAFKKPKSFKIAFYTFALLFGSIHISNFEITTSVLLLSPLLVLPQILLGSYFGYIRVRLGLPWSMLLHGCYNGTLILIRYLFES
ncbi:MAG: membrane protease YdiL (CAAX protease family) [Polaribacter sp.]|jgi:membrane protease YdiL (CAAX protease family)|tara:strand:- start:421 stop:969 length:549 start_codon:yes stop_codon:yes gene_type:complete